MPLADWDADLKEIAGDFSSALVYGVDSIKCVASQVTQSANIDEDGMSVPEVWDVVATRSDFTSIPEDRSPVTLDGFPGHIDGIEDDPKSDSIRFTVRRS